MTTIARLRRSLILPMLLIAGLGSTACSGGGPAQTAASSTPPTSTTAANSVAAIDPCGLLSAADVAQLGLAVRGPEQSVKSRGCGWTKSTSYSVGIYANPSQGLDALRADNSTTTMLPSHDAIETANSDIDCLYDIAITKTSSVDISVEATTSGIACQIAVQYATLIEPKLPAQQK